MMIVSDMSKASASSLDVDIKAFKGKGDLRALAQQYAQALAKVLDEMEALAAETAGIDSSIVLRCVHSRTVDTGAARAKLRWSVTGHTGYLSFERVRALFDRVPQPLHAYYERVNQRADTLNTLETVFRTSLTQLDTYLRIGRLRGQGNKQGS